MTLGNNPGLGKNHDHNPGLGKNLNVLTDGPGLSPLKNKVKGKGLGRHLSDGKISVRQTPDGGSGGQVKVFERKGAVGVGGVEGIRHDDMGGVRTRERMGVVPKLDLIRTIGIEAGTRGGGDFLTGNNVIEVRGNNMSYFVNWAQKNYSPKELGVSSKK